MSTNLNKLIFSVETPVRGTEPSASSTQNDVSLPIDGYVGYLPGHYFVSQQEIFPWFQLEFSFKFEVARVIVTQRLDTDVYMFSDIAIFVSDNPATIGQMTESPQCATYQGPSEIGKIDIITCTNRITGTYLIIQKMAPDIQTLSFSEVAVHGSMVLSSPLISLIHLILPCRKRLYCSRISIKCNQFEHVSLGRPYRLPSPPCP